MDCNLYLSHGMDDPQDNERLDASKQKQPLVYLQQRQGFAEDRGYEKKELTWLHRARQVYKNI